MGRDGYWALLGSQAYRFCFRFLFGLSFRLQHIPKLRNFCNFLPAKRHHTHLFTLRHVLRQMNDMIWKGCLCFSSSSDDGGLGGGCGRKQKLLLVQEPFTGKNRDRLLSFATKGKLDFLDVHITRAAAATTTLRRCSFFSTWV